jgi:hypothetical protein
LDIIKQILALHILEYDVVVVRILKKIDEGHDVWVLRHLQGINFSPLLVDFDWFHIFLVYCLNSYLFARFLVASEFDKTKLTLAQVRLDVIIFEHV